MSKKKSNLLNLLGIYFNHKLLVNKKFDFLFLLKKNKMNSDWVFNKTMRNILDNKVSLETAKLTAKADMVKVSSNTLTNMIIDSCQTELELIKNMAGFMSMSSSIQKYYTNPKQALIDYTTDPSNE